MTLALDLPPALLVRVEARAQERGLALDPRAAGELTLAQIRHMSQLLADRAEELYRRADRVERGTAASRLPKALSVAALARRVARAGQADDPVTRSTCARLAATLDGRSASPKEIRAAAIELLDLAQGVAGARYLPRWRWPGTTTRPRVCQTPPSAADGSIAASV